MKNKKILFFGFIIFFLGVSIPKIYHHYSNENIYLLNLNTDINKNNIFYYGYIKNLSSHNLNINNYNNTYELFKQTKNKEELQKLLIEKFGGPNNIINKIKFKKEITFYQSYHLSKFNYMFDKDMNGSCWGINKQSNSLLTQNIKINYFKNENDYSISIFDKNDNEIILLKNQNFKTYQNSYDYYIDNKNDLNEFILGKDTLIIKNIEKNTFGKLKNEEFKNYYISLDIHINGYSDKQNEQLNSLNIEDKYNFDFREDTTIFIKNKNENIPYMALNY